MAALIPDERCVILASFILYLQIKTQQAMAGTKCCHLLGVGDGAPLSEAVTIELETNLSPLVDVDEKVAELPVVFVDQLDPLRADFLEGHHGRADDQGGAVAQQLLDDTDKLLFLQKKFLSASLTNFSLVQFSLVTQPISPSFSSTSSQDKVATPILSNLKFKQVAQGSILGKKSPPLKLGYKNASIYYSLLLQTLIVFRPSPSWIGSSY